MVSSFRPRLWPGYLLAPKNILRGFGDFFVLGVGGGGVGGGSICGDMPK